MARLLAALRAELLVGASLRALLLFQIVEACQTKVSALEGRGRGTVPLVVDLVVLSSL